MQAIITILRSGSSQGFIWAILAIGVFISYRMLDSADLTIEGSMPLGACVSAALIMNGVNPWVSLLIAFLAGCGAGAITAIFHTVFKIPVLLGGIITMTGLFSVNRFICESAGSGNMGSLITINNNNTIFSGLSTLANLRKTDSVIIISLLILVVIGVLIYLFFGTELGAGIRGTGMNKKMAKSLGINTSIMEIIGLALSNGLISLSGALYAQSSGQATIDQGRGAIVIGLASIILGEAIIGKRSFLNSLLAVIGGSIMYQLIMAITVQLGFPDIWFKLFSAVLLAVVLAIPTFRKWGQKGLKRINQSRGGKNA